MLRWSMLSASAFTHVRLEQIVFYLQSAMPLSRFLDDSRLFKRFNESTNDVFVSNVSNYIHTPTYWYGLGASYVALRE
jgi:hypothetical protein